MEEGGRMEEGGWGYEGHIDACMAMNKKTPHIHEVGVIMNGLIGAIKMIE